MMPLLSFRGKPSKLGLIDGHLITCPASPNCVCSANVDPAHAIDPFRIITTTTDATTDIWPLVEAAVGELPRTRITTRNADYLHAECASVFFGFVDDLELHLRRDDAIIALRSASRLGYSDFGVNRRRIERLRAILRTQNILR
jgi:uncharacterized protein (DUF1499 family)